MLDSGEDKGAVVVERNSVLCARLTHTKQLYQDQMMSNYLESACQRSVGSIWLYLFSADFQLQFVDFRNTSDYDNVISILAKIRA